MRIPFMKQIAWYLVIAVFIIGVAPRVEAGFAPSELIALAQTDRAADMGRIQQVLETKMIRERLAQMGFAREEINQRLTQLNDEQVHQLALQIDDLKVGGDGALGVISALLIIAILVVMLLKLTKHQIVITK